jgi:hypothetical protein
VAPILEESDKTVSHDGGILGDHDTHGFTFTHGGVARQ